MTKRCQEKSHFKKISGLTKRKIDNESKIAIMDESSALKAKILEEV